MSVSIGTLVEGAFPVTLYDTPAYSIAAKSQQYLFVNRTLFARPYLLSIHTSGDERVDVILLEVGGAFRHIVNAVVGVTEYGVLPFRGVFNLAIRNLNESSTRLRILFQLYGLDQQQVLLGLVLYASGFVSCLAHFIAEWLKNPADMEDAEKEKVKGESRPRP
jgi:hypothetical protein